MLAAKTYMGKDKLKYIFYFVLYALHALSSLFNTAVKILEFLKDISAKIFLLLWTKILLKYCSNCFNVVWFFYFVMREGCLSDLRSCNEFRRIKVFVTHYFAEEPEARGFASPSRLK